MVLSAFRSKTDGVHASHFRSRVLKPDEAFHTGGVQFPARPLPCPHLFHAGSARFLVE